MSTLVQKPAPEFKATAVMPDNTIRQDFSSAELEGRYAILFFYPYDFSFVCPTEILALNRHLEEFKRRNCEVVCISVDSHFSHVAWKKTREEDGGIGAVGFPLVADLTKEISRSYGVLDDEAVSLRATFLLDRSGIVRHATVNDLDLGRNVREIIRTLDAVRHIDETGELCPSDWDPSATDGAPPAGIKKQIQNFDLSSS